MPGCDMRIPRVVAARMTEAAAIDAVFFTGSVGNCG